MKKIIFSLAFIGAMLTSCVSNNAEIDYAGKDAVDVVVGINVPELAASRAGETAMNSGLGAIDNFDSSNDEWEKYDIRYILEVYDATEGFENFDTPIKSRVVETADYYQSITIDLRLIPNRTYKFVAWADFVEQGKEEDLNYNTANLKNITRRTGNPTAMDESMDAYFIQEDVYVNENINKSLTLTRPFGKIRVITTDANEVNLGTTPKYVDVAFYNYPIFTSLNALTGETESTVSDVTYSYEIAKDAPYSEGYDSNGAYQTLFADYIFAMPKEYGAQEVNFTMDVYDEKGRVICEHDFNTQIPLERNSLTTIMGNLFTTTADFGISIDDDFDGSYEIGINPDAPRLATPNVTSVVDGNIVTLSWEPVENADFYTVTLNYNEHKVDGTSTTFNLDYESEYIFYVTACSNDTMNYNESEAAAISVWTEPGVEPGEVTELTIVSHDFGWTSEMETEVIFREATPGVEHIVDFRMTGIQPGTYNSNDGGIFLNYSRYMYGHIDYNYGVQLDSANATITDNGDTTFTFDVTFVAEGNTYHFTYTTPAQEAEESGNVVELVSKSAGEKIGSYAWGWTLADAEGNNSVTLVVDEENSVDKTADFPKANYYTSFKSSVGYVFYSDDFSFVNGSLRVNGVNYNNDEVSNATMTVVEGTSITIEFNVGGENYTFVYTESGDEPGVEPGEVTELTIVSHDFGYTAQMETEVIFTQEDGNKHLIDFIMNGIQPGTYNSDDGGISLFYSRYMYDGYDGVQLDSANATIVDNGDTTFTFDVTFVAEGNTYHFTYTTPAEEQGGNEGGNEGGNDDTKSFEDWAFNAQLNMGTNTITVTDGSHTVEFTINQLSGGTFYIFDSGMLNITKVVVNGVETTDASGTVEMGASNNYHIDLNCTINGVNYTGRSNNPVV